MISSGFIHHFENLLSEKIITAKPLSGGDINEFFLVHTTNKKIVVKLNSASRFPDMFEAEAKGLQTLQNSNTFTIPRVLYQGEVNTTAFLMLEYIASSKKAINFWEMFAEQLANLHKNSEAYFGFDSDNYIGSLPQYNSKCNSASEFYISQRLQPQFDLAVQNGFSFDMLGTFYKNIADEIPDEPSSLIHGDLWSGNFMIDSNGLPCLIDPAVAYASREMDIAMMYLFGGFDASLFEWYNHFFPLEKGWKERICIFQLYYLLVHLNLFGSSYHGRVRNIVNRYS